jgi:hypothetical protein
VGTLGAMRRSLAAIALTGWCLLQVAAPALAATRGIAGRGATAPTVRQGIAGAGAAIQSATRGRRTSAGATQTAIGTIALKRSATPLRAPFSKGAAQSAPTATSNPEAPVPVAPSVVPPPGRRLSADQVLEIANRLPKLRRVRAQSRGSYGGAYLKGPGRWQVSYFARGGKEIGQVIIADVSGRVVEQWTGFQVAWTMARGYPGAFGRHVNALYIWLTLCVLFLVPFVDWRRPFSLLHLDLLVLLSFSVSLAFFNHADIYASVPLTYPPLVYLLVRMLMLVRGRAQRAPRLWIPTRWLAVGVVFLLGFRIALNVTDSNVIDVGYAGVIGAHRIAHGKPLYGGYPADNEHGDTYGPVNYEAYVPFEQIFGWSGTWDDLPAAHAAAIFFDIVAAGLMFLLGLRIRGPTLGVALAYAWVSYPFTLFALESNSNDTIVAVLVLAALLVASTPPARGVFAALAGLTKFAPLALVPLFATYGLRELSVRRRPLAFGLFLGAFALTAVLVSIPAVTHDSLHEIYERTIAYQDARGAPFSVWGLYGGLDGVQHGVQIAAVALALALAVIPRRPGLPALAAAAAAILIALQLGLEYWFYLYIPWFFPLAMIALLGVPAASRGEPSRPLPAGFAGAASEPARSSPLAVA